MRDCCLRRDRPINSGCCQLGAVEVDQNSFGGRRFGAEDGILDARWVPASAPAIPALVRRFAANRRSDSALWDERNERRQGRFARFPTAAHWWFPTSHQTARDMIMPNRGVSSRVRAAEPTSPSLEDELIFRSVPKQ
jgi:hypothetical protein